ncbi:hypothetical protein BAUCODRAFT_147735 [Baudoinia panamericana UAMH 10762]|uniref:Aquaporin-like protein n=1 Tax=Baudoinia panamericana (strain UAMH 10762) TaxID=717646 RepID=M2NEL8_BAUPA|nr:uncharacterized protein BAUCODRAFT_147735 [Baudoinia panamericana UAMH 10762]EMC97689.1 hypothetical protein BAUCODRAFT_147735 [Baudoinia panamericana UAMH 10762]
MAEPKPIITQSTAVRRQTEPISHTSTKPSTDPASFVRSSAKLRPIVSTPAFAGRIGGNQEFVSTDNAQIEKQPDAAPLHRLSDALNLNVFLDRQIWVMAVIEGWGTCILIFIFGAGASGLTSIDASPLASTLYAALLNFVGLTLFVFAAAPASGGHLNPSITLATFFAGLCTLPRAVLYVIAQCVGAIVGSYWLKLGLGDAYFPSGIIPGCTVDPTLVSRGQLFVLEYMFSQALIFTAFGVGLDPRQATVFGPALAPILVGMTLGLGTLASSLAKPGYTGLSFNSARCLGFMVAKGDMQYHYIHWLATLAATMLNGVFYHFAPPYVRGKPRAAVVPLHHV